MAFDTTVKAETICNAVFPVRYIQVAIGVQLLHIFRCRPLDSLPCLRSFVRSNRSRGLRGNEDSRSGRSRSRGRTGVSGVLPGPSCEILFDLPVVLVKLRTHLLQRDQVPGTIPVPESLLDPERESLIKLGAKGDGSPASIGSMARKLNNIF